MPALNFSLSPFPSRIDLLREHTRTAHDAIEAMPGMRRLMATDYTINEYEALLLRLLGYIEPLERMLNYAPKAHFQLGCSRTACLYADLAEIGAKPLANAQRAGFSALDFADESVRAGICYVLEGSALGGQVIRRALNQNLGTRVANAINYFDCYHGKHGKVWRSTLSQIEQTPNLDATRMVGAAAEIFGSLHAWLGANREAHPAEVLSGLKQTGAKCPFARFSNWIGL